MRVVTGAMERKCSATWSQSVRNRRRSLTNRKWSLIAGFVGVSDESTRFNELTTFVLTSIESFADKQAVEVNCPHGGISCRFTRMLDIVDKSYPWKRWEVFDSNFQSVCAHFPFSEWLSGSAAAAMGFPWHHHRKCFRLVKINWTSNRRRATVTIQSRIRSDRNINLWWVGGGQNHLISVDVKVWLELWL